jgi:hypothetical protein
LSNGLWDEQR